MPIPEPPGSSSSSRSDAPQPSVRRSSSGDRADPRDEGQPPGLDADRVARFGRGEGLVFDGVLGRAASLALAENMRAREGSLRPAAIGRTAVRLVEPEVRGDSTCWLDRGDGPGLELLWAMFDRVGVELRERAWLGPLEQEVQLALYPGDGASYRRHADAIAGVGRRRATAIYYLNPDWVAADGGQLRIFGAEAGDDADFAPLLDRLIVFRSRSVEHSVQPCAARRWAVTAWFLAPGPP